MIFDLSGLNDTQRAIVEQALVRCTFDFDQIALNFRRDTGRQLIRVVFRSFELLGLATYQEGLIEIREDLVGEPELAGATFLHEAAHFVAVFGLTDSQWQAAMEALDFAGPLPTTGWFVERTDADYWASGVEAWANVFVDAFSNYPPEDYGYLYRSSERIAKRIREIVQPATELFAFQLRRSGALNGWMYH